MGDGGQARAIGAGLHSSAGTDQALSREQRRVRQRRAFSASVIDVEHAGTDEGERANACTRQGQGQHIDSSAMTTSTSVNGRPMTRNVKHLPDKEKDRCANTGLLQEVSLVVTVGIRSDRRQTA
jgi:hypothetical protein